MKIPTVFTLSAALALSLFPLHLMASPSANPPESLAPLIDAISKRLEIADDVALSKWHSGKPVQDTDRERQVITNVTLQAEDFKLPRDDVRQFFAAQIEANKMVQYARLAQWHANGAAPANSAQSLANDIRSRLDTLQPTLLKSYAAFFPYRQNIACPAWLSAESEKRTSDPVIATALVRAAEGLCLTNQKS